MTANGPTSAPMKKGRLIAATAGALVAGTLIVFGAILPAEYDIDVLGLGKLSGLSRLWAPPEKSIDTRNGSMPLAREYPAAWRSDTIEIPLGGFLEGNDRSALEYKVRMKEGATLIYDWQVVGGDEVLYDFHGHTVQASREDSMTVASYKQGVAARGSGALTAPFEGIQGWQFSNSGEKPLVVRVRLAGFYDMVPAGEEGNLAGIIAGVPAAQARTIFKPKV